jgi:hypothetical protein
MAEFVPVLELSQVSWSRRRSETPQFQSDGGFCALEMRIQFQITTRVAALCMQNGDNRQERCWQFQKIEMRLLNLISQLIGPRSNARKFFDIYEFSSLADLHGDGSNMRLLSLYPLFSLKYLCLHPFFPRVYTKVVGVGCRRAHTPFWKLKFETVCTLKRNAKFSGSDKTKCFPCRSLFFAFWITSHRIIFLCVYIYIKDNVYQAPLYTRPNELWWS